MPRRSTVQRLSAVAVAAAGAIVAGALAAPPAYAVPVTKTIAEVQGTAAASPLVGTTVTVEGVVTADHRTGGYGGIYVQTPGPDTSGTASDAIFVFLNGANPGVAIGDLVHATGTVAETNGLTRINATEVHLVAPQVGVPAATALPASLLGSARESLEGMLVSPQGTYKVISSHQLDAFGALWLNAGSAMPVEAFETLTPTTKNSAGETIVNPAVTALNSANRNSRVLLDDGYSLSTSDTNHPGNQPYFTKGTVVRNGDVVVFPSAPYVLGFDFGDWRLQPTTPISSVDANAPRPTFKSVDGTTVVGNPRPATPPAVGGDIQVAAFNVLNYFTTLTSQNPDARGADTAEEFAVQKAKIVKAITALDADIVALQEIENSVKLGEKPDEALADLVAGLNAAAGSKVWDYVRTPKVLHDAAITDVITNAIIFKPAVVSLSGNATTIVDETVWDIAREPIAQTFKFGKQFVTVVANHFKSKSNNPADPTPETGQDPYNGERVEQAESLLAFAKGLQANRKSDVYLVGDFNSYAQEDPMKVFAKAGWSDILPIKAKGQYTYTFDGELGSLDHVIASPSAVDKVTKAGVWSINSPEWVGREYWNVAAETLAEATPYRSSDHDPIIVGVATEGAPGKTVDIDLATVNDFHGRIEQTAPSGGIAALSTAVKQIRAGNPNTVFAAAGDMIGASTFTSFIQQDVPTIEALNAAGLDVSSVGNHEFDQGFADLTDRVMPLAQWEYLGANVYEKGTTTPALPEYWTQTFNDVTIGFVGAVTDELPSLVSPGGIADISVGDPAEAANRVADQLSDGNDANGEADIVILLVHEGATTTSLSSATDASTRFGHIVNETVMQSDTNIDAIVSGHTHLAYNHVINGKPVISSGQYGEKFSKMEITWDKSLDQISKIENETFDLMNGAAPLWADDPAVKPIVDEAVKVANDLGSKVLGTATADFGRAVASTPVPGQSLPENRGGESTLGNLVADVQLWSLNEDGTRDVDIAFMNTGGLRADLASGEVTYREAADVQPFANTLVTMNLTGAKIKQVLEEQWQPAGASRPFLKLGINKEFTYTYNPNAAAGAHITEMFLNGVAIDPTATYVVGVNSFLASGGDNFLTLNTGTNKADSGKVDLEAMVDYFEAAPNHTISPDLAQRAVGVIVQGDGTYAVGEQVTVNLSSLEFTRSEPTANTVAVTFGGAPIATGTVDRIFTPTVDEVGKSTVTFTVPAGTSGPTRFGVTTPLGTSSSFVINVG